MAPPRWGPTWKLKRDATSPSVFISYTKNKKILEQIKQMLEFIDFEYEVGVEWETGSTPLPEKVFNLMRKCNCAVINIGTEEQEKRQDGDTV